MSLFRKRRGRDEPSPAVPVRAAYDAAPGEAAYERLVAAAMLLRNLDADLVRTEAGLAERVARLQQSAAEYERLAQAAIAGGRVIQAESAIASAETAQAALDALAPRAGEVEALRAEVTNAVSRIEGEAAALRRGLDSRTPVGEPAPAAGRAEDDAVRLTSLARSLSY